MILRSTLVIAPDHPDLEGHFPGMPIFPAVSQLELVIRAISTELGVPVQMALMKRAKFKAILRPGTSVSLTVDILGGEEARWLLQDAEQVYSQGQLLFVVHGAARGALEASLLT